MAIIYHMREESKNTRSTWVLQRVFSLVGAQSS